MNITYITGDATTPVGSGNKIIVHVCNDLGKWGKGFVLAISKRWRAPEAHYKAAFSEERKPQLGEVQFVAVTDEITVANVIGQHGIVRRNAKNGPPIRYEAIRQGLAKVADFAQCHGASVHMPRIGCGLAGGTWDKIEPILAETLGGRKVDTYVYDF